MHVLSIPQTCIIVVSGKREQPLCSLALSRMWLSSGFNKSVNRIWRTAFFSLMHPLPVPTSHMRSVQCFFLQHNQSVKAILPHHTELPSKERWLMGKQEVEFSNYSFPFGRRWWCHWSPCLLHTHILPVTTDPLLYTSPCFLLLFPGARSIQLPRTSCSQWQNSKKIPWMINNVGKAPFAL